VGFDVEDMLSWEIRVFVEKEGVEVCEESV
jgi:hypothetical protein